MITHAHHRQSGAVLVVGLIILSVLIMIGVTAINSSSIGEKLTANQRNKELSLQASQSALIDGEQWLVSQTQAPISATTCALPPCNVFATGVYSNLHLKTSSWWSTNARLFSGNIYQVTSQPQYLLEQFNFIPYELSPEARSKGEGYYYYQVTARGAGGNDQATSIVQSIYTVQFK